MMWEINGRECKFREIKTLSYRKFRQRTKLALYLPPSGKEPYEYQEITLRIVGLCKDTNSVVIEPKLINYKGRAWHGIPTEKTRREQLSYLSDKQLAKYITPRNKPMNLKKKDFVIELALEDWLEITGHSYLRDVVLYDDLSDNEFIAALFKANKPISIEELADIMDCPCNVALYHINSLKTKGQINWHKQSNSNGLYVVLSSHITEQLNEGFNKRDKELLGKHDNIVYLTGRLFAVVDNTLTKQNGKGMTLKQFNRACTNPFEVFTEILTPALHSYNTDKFFASALRVLTMRIGTNNGKSNMPICLNKEDQEMFKLGFDEMYNTMTQYK